MGAHESEPSGKRFRRGSAIKYRHKKFRIESTPEVLNKIKRKTCPTEQTLELAKNVKEARQLEAHLGLQYKRFKDILHALTSEIDDREKEVKRRKLEENRAAATQSDNDKVDNLNYGGDDFLIELSSFHQQASASSPLSSGTNGYNSSTKSVDSVLKMVKPVDFDETLQLFQNTSDVPELKATEFGYDVDWTANDEQYMFDFLTSLWFIYNMIVCS